jgi:6-phosphofructokinase 2
MTADELDKCGDAVVDAAEGARCVVISGSMPRDADPKVISQLVERLPDATVIIDTSGPALAEAMTSGAHLVKPSARELSSLVGRPLDTEQDIVEAAVELMGRSNVEVLVASIGAGGAVAVTADETSTRFRAPTVKVRSAVGAGDSMVAGMAVGIQRGLSTTKAVALGVAAGTAACLTDGTELCTPHDVERLLPSVAH